MGILIPNMEMPKNCAECNVNDAAKCGTNYKYLLEHEAYYDAVRQDCPLIEQKTGKWLRTPTYWVYCSVCDREPPNETNETTPYCPWCGAKMENY